MPQEPLVTLWARGPRMAVWAYFAFDGRIVDEAGTRADWAWAMAQWDRIAAAGSAVRLVVADQPYSRLDVRTTEGQARLQEVTAKIGACVAAGQLVFGRLYVAGGRLPVGNRGDYVDDPLRPGHLVPSVSTQFHGWLESFPQGISGFYLDSGPTQCIDAGVVGSVPDIPVRYFEYGGIIGHPGYHLAISAPQYADAPTPARPQGWLRQIPGFIEVWEGGMLPYQSRFEAKDPCRPTAKVGVPAWWDPGPQERWSRMHVITDCIDADRMRAAVRLGVTQRAAGTMWVTCARQDRTYGAVFDVLPAYWDEEVAVFQSYVDIDERNREKAAVNQLAEYLEAHGDHDHDGLLHHGDPDEVSSHVVLVPEADAPSTFIRPEERPVLGQPDKEQHQDDSTSKHGNGREVP